MGLGEEGNLVYRGTGSSKALINVLSSHHPLICVFMYLDRLLIVERIITLQVAPSGGRRAKPPPKRAIPKKKKKKKKKVLVRQFKRGGGARTARINGTIA